MRTIRTDTPRLIMTMRGAAPVLMPRKHGAPGDSPITLELGSQIKIHLLCKRYYTGKDLILDRFGRLYHLPIQLARLGTRVAVTAIDYRNPRAESHEMGGVTFCTLSATPARLPGFWMKLLREIRANPPDILIASGDSHIGYLGMRIARGLGIPFVFDVYDYYPAFASNRIPGMKTLFGKAVEGADLVLCASSPLMDRLAGLNAVRLLIDNGVDRRLFAPMDRTAARSRLGIGNETPVIGYFGSVLPTRGPLLIDACRQLRRERPSLTLLLAGPVSGVDLSETWIHHLGEAPQQVVPELISACDVVTVPYANDAFNGMCGACKIAEYLSCGKPVVATDTAGHRDSFAAAPQSLCRPDPADMAEAIRRQLDHPQVAPFPPHLEWAAIATALSEALNALRPAGSRS